MISYVCSYDQNQSRLRRIFKNYDTRQQRGKLRYWYTKFLENLGYKLHNYSMKAKYIAVLDLPIIKIIILYATLNKHNYVV